MTKTVTRGRMGGCRTRGARGRYRHSQDRAACRYGQRDRGQDRGRDAGGLILESLGVEAEGASRFAVIRAAVRLGGANAPMPTMQTPRGPSRRRAASGRTTELNEAGSPHRT
jgi:hypothetical protein